MNAGVIKSSKVALVSLMLVITQFMVFSQVNLASAQEPISVGQGDLSLEGKVIPSHIGKSDITGPPVTIPLRTPVGQSAQKGGGGPALQVPLSTTRGHLRPPTP